MAFENLRKKKRHTYALRFFALIIHCSKCFTYICLHLKDKLNKSMFYFKYQKSLLFNRKKLYFDVDIVAIK